MTQESWRHWSLPRRLRAVSAIFAVVLSLLVGWVLDAWLHGIGVWSWAVVPAASVMLCASVLVVARYAGQHASQNEELLSDTVECVAAARQAGCRACTAGYHAAAAAAVDVFEAPGSERPYRKASTHEYAVEYIGPASGKRLDPKVGKLFQENMSHAPAARVNLCENPIMGAFPGRSP